MDNTGGEGAGTLHEDGDDSWCGVASRRRQVRGNGDPDGVASAQDRPVVTPGRGESTIPRRRFPRSSMVAIKPTDDMSILCGDS